MVVDPWKNTEETVERVRGQSGLTVGLVEDVSPENHVVRYRDVAGSTPLTNGKSNVAAVMVPQRGDFVLPSEGNLVIVAELISNQPIVLGTYHNRQNQIRDVESAQERHIGAQDNDGLYLHGPFGVVPKRADDPQNAPDGAVWYRTDLGEYRGIEGGTTVSFDTTSV